MPPPWILLPVAICLATPTPAWSQDATSRRALIIANGDYANIRKLDNPKIDAASLRKAFEALSMDDVQVVLDASRKGLRRGLATFVQGLSPTDTAFVYYAGHGLEISGSNYLLGVDFEATGRADAAAEGYALSTVMQMLRERGPGANIIVLDACRDDPFPGEANRSLAPAGFARVDHMPEGTYIALSTAPGLEAADGEPGRGSPFANALSQQLLLEAGGEVFRDIDLVFRTVRQDVLEATGSVQLPWSRHSLVDTLHLSKFRETPGAVAVALAPPPPQPTRSTALETESLAMRIAVPPAGDAWTTALHWMIDHHPSAELAGPGKPAVLELRLLPDDRAGLFLADEPPEEAELLTFGRTDRSVRAVEQAISVIGIFFAIQPESAAIELAADIPQPIAATLTAALPALGPVIAGEDAPASLRLTHDADGERYVLRDVRTGEKVAPPFELPCTLGGTGCKDPSALTDPLTEPIAWWRNTMIARQMGPSGFGDVAAAMGEEQQAGVDAAIEVFIRSDDPRVERVGRDHYYLPGGAEMDIDVANLGGEPAWVYFTNRSQWANGAGSHAQLAPGEVQSVTVTGSPEGGQEFLTAFVVPEPVDLSGCFGGAPDAFTGTIPSGLTAPLPPGTSGLEALEHCVGAIVTATASRVIRLSVDDR